MLLGEPPPTQGDLHFSLLGIPVRIHPFFWLVGLMLGMNSRNAQGMLVWVAVLFVAILFHELGHAFAFRVYGMRPRIVLYGLGGLTSPGDSYGNSARRLGTMQNIFISAAGPGAGFLLAAVIIGALRLTNYHIASELFADFVNGLLYFCIIWGIVNLLPVYPLDGGQIAREILLYFSARNGIRQSLMLSVFTATLLAVYGLAILKQPFIAILFGYLAYSSYTTLQAHGGHGRW